MLEKIRDIPGRSLRPLNVYMADSDRYLARASRFVKLERLQDFREPHLPSWVALADGRWDDAMRLLQDRRPIVADEFATDRANGLVSYRVRVVEYPLTPYMHWELRALKLRTEYGENIRVIGTEAVKEFESTGRPVPELIFMDADAMYEIDYDEEGTLVGGRKITDSNVVRSALAEVWDLYQKGENFADFFAREIETPDSHSAASTARS